MPTDWENTIIQEGIEGRAVKVYFNLILFWLREAKKLVLFGSIDPPPEKERFRSQKVIFTVNFRQLGVKYAIKTVI